MTADDPQELTGLPMADLSVGRRASRTRTISAHAIDLAAAIAGQATPPSPDRADPAAALLVEALFNDLVAQELPGPGSVVVRADVTLVAAPRAGEETTATLAVASLDANAGEAVLEGSVGDAAGRAIATARLIVRPPAQRLIWHAPERPTIVAQGHPHLMRLFEVAKTLPPLRFAVAWPCDREGLLGPLDAMQRGLGIPTLVGPRAAIEAAAREAGVTLEGAEIVEAATPAEAAQRAVELCRTGRADGLMKGSLHTDVLMSAAVAREGGLRTGRRISHVFAIDVPAYRKALFVTDAAVNVAPDLEAKVDIVQNAIDLLRAAGYARPKVAVLAAVETVNPKMPATVDAAALAKMAQRGQISGGIVDGPLALDNAVSRAAARIKHIESAVAGDADVLVAPDLESGNILAKQFTYLAGAQYAGIVLGASVPIVLTSRADSVVARVASIAMASIYLAGRRAAPPA